MAQLPEIMPVTALRQDAAAILSRVRKSNQPLIVTEAGRAAAVMMSVEAYERSEHERQLLRLLACGERDIAQGTGHDLDDVLAAADAILQTTRS